MLLDDMKNLHPNRNLLAGALAASALALLPGSALGATVQRVGSVVKYTAAPGETNNVVARPSGTRYLLDDAGATITDGDGAGGCSVAGTRVTCTLAGISRVEVDTGDR